MLTIEELAQLAREPRELRFKEVENIFYNYGYIIINSKGSHFRFKKEKFPSITIVVHNKKVKKWYVKTLAKILLSQIPL